MDNIQKENSEGMTLKEWQNYVLKTTTPKTGVNVVIGEDGNKYEGFTHIGIGGPCHISFEEDWRLTFGSDSSDSDDD